MTISLNEIFELEDNNKFDEVFVAYTNLYNTDKNNFEVWKHFYFFLWTAIEDAPSSFQEKISLRKLLQVMFDEGKNTFADNADFNFIAGYTVSIFPYEFGEYEDLEIVGNDMLLKATKLQPDNLIYKMVYLSSIADVNRQQYRQAKIDAAPNVLETFSGPGALNKYFRQVLYRLNNKAYR